MELETLENRQEALCTESTTETAAEVTPGESGPQEGTLDGGLRAAAADGDGGNAEWGEEAWTGVSKEEANGSGGVAAEPSQGPATVELEVVRPWEEAVDGAALLDSIVRELQRFVVLPPWAGEMLALWIVHSYAFRLRNVTTYVGIESPEKECGKSTLVTVLSEFVERAAVSSNISSSAFYRSIEELQATLFIDEADTNLRGKDDLTGILNSGYTKATAFVWRVCYDARAGRGRAKEGGKAAVGGPAGRVARYSCWCPKAIAAIGRLNPTLASRCIVIRMQRKTNGEECERLKKLNPRELKRKCARFVADHARGIAEAEPMMPPGLANRAADIWEPLLALADLAGGEWPERARQAAVGLTARSEERSPISSLLLDIFLAFVTARRERLFTRELVEVLSRAGERPWRELHRGKGVSEMWLARQLRPYGVRPRTLRIGTELGKGYAQEDFRESCRRYIPQSEWEALHQETAEQEKLEAEQKAAANATAVPAGAMEGGQREPEPEAAMQANS